MAAWDRIRTTVRVFCDRPFPEIFPGRERVPKPISPWVRSKQVSIQWMFAPLKNWDQDGAPWRFQRSEA